MKVIKWIKALWKDPVSSKIIAAVILGSASVWLVVFKNLVSKRFAYLITEKVTINLATLIVAASMILIVHYYLLKIKVSKVKKRASVLHSSVDPVKVEMDKIKAEHQQEIEQKILAKVQPLSNHPDEAWKVFMGYGLTGKDLQRFLYKYREQLDQSLYRKIAIRIAD
ncbi:MAG: hypothetical protein RIC35_04995 [Marinoscillum sp.]